MSKDKQIPEVLQQILQDKNQDGMPDIVEQALQNQGGATNTNITTNVATMYVVHGKQYNSLEEMSAEDRAYVKKNAEYYITRNITSRVNAIVTYSSS